MNLIKNPMEAARTTLTSREENVHLETRSGGCNVTLPLLVLVWLSGTWCENNNSAVPFHTHVVSMVLSKDGDWGLCKTGRDQTHVICEVLSAGVNAAGGGLWPFELQTLRQYAYLYSKSHDQNSNESCDHSELTDGVWMK